MVQQSIDFENDNHINTEWNEWDKLVQNFNRIKDKFRKINTGKTACRRIYVEYIEALATINA